MLCDSASVPLHFVWPDGQAIDLDTKFTRATESAEDNVLTPTSGLLH
jgi:hypothetical protein